ncbi:MAG: N-acetyltransferase family protein [Candidatus Helarchaeota archaeon]|nr:N-acetyltransferase family protein [Candidatus Helarchaeota archaeon]
MDIKIQKMEDGDWASVISIFNEGIETGYSTLITECPSWEEWDRRYLKNCRFVVKSNNQIIGWAALTPFSSIPAYSGVAEVSIYLTSSARSKGIGKSLLKTVIKESEKNGIWMLQAKIFSENIASISLHKACGFREVGIRERIGQLKGKWRDIVLMERRSSTVGI